MTVQTVAAMKNQVTGGDFYGIYLVVTLSYNHATSNLAIYSHESSQDNL